MFIYVFHLWLLNFLHWIYFVLNLLHTCHNPDSNYFSHFLCKTVLLVKTLLLGEMLWSLLTVFVVWVSKMALKIVWFYPSLLLKKTTGGGWPQLVLWRGIVATIVCRFQDCWWPRMQVWIHPLSRQQTADIWWTLNHINMELSRCSFQLSFTLCNMQSTNAASICLECWIYVNNLQYCNINGGW